MKILLIDDEPDLLDYYEGLLGELGVEILKAHDNPSAFQAIIEHRPELVITDLIGSRLDGLDIIKKAKKQGLKSQFVVVSGAVQMDLKKITIENELTSLFFKPFEPECISHIVERKKGNLALFKKHSKEIREFKTAVSGVFKRNRSQAAICKDIVEFIRRELDWPQIGLYRLKGEWDQGVELQCLFGPVKDLKDLKACPVLEKVALGKDFWAASDKDFEEIHVKRKPKWYPQPQSLVIKYHTPDSEPVLLTCSGKKGAAKEDVERDYAILSECLTLLGCFV